MTIKQILITSLLLSLLVVSSAFIPDTAKAQTEQEPADNFQLQAYLTEEQALALIFPECDEIVTDEFVMTPEEKSSLEKLLSRRLYEDGFKTYIGRKNGAIQRSGNSILLPLLWAWARMGKSLISLSWFTVRAAAERLPKSVFSISSWGNPSKIQSGSTRISSMLPEPPCPCSVCAQA